MSNLDLQEFHSFLEQLIDQAPGDGRRWTDRIVNSILTEHAERLDKIQSHVLQLGIRTLIRNNCRARNRSSPDNQLKLFEEYSTPKRISVPYHDEDGKFGWKSRRREDITLEELDSTIRRWSERPSKPSKALQGLMKLAERAKPFREKTTTLMEALEMAQKDAK